MTVEIPDLPQRVRQALADFLAAAREAFGENLRSAVLFGSAAEGRLRDASDVNLLLVLDQDRPDQWAAIEQPLNFAAAAIRLRVLLVTTAELEPASQLFAQKFNDIMHRRQVLYGGDPFTSIRIAPEALRRRVAQVLLNLQLRMRERLAANWSREDQLTEVLLDTIGPIRTCAANLLELEGSPSASPKQAIATLCAQAEPRFSRLPDEFSRLREGTGTGQIPVRECYSDTMRLIAWMRGRLA